MIIQKVHKLFDILEYNSEVESELDEDSKEIDYPDTEASTSESDDFVEYGSSTTDDDSNIRINYYRLLNIQTEVTKPKPINSTINPIPKKLPRYTDESCCICMDKWGVISRCYCTCCGTLFHYECYNKCIKKTCPVCRRQANHIHLI